MKHRCPYCFADTESRQGLHSHMMQKKTCRENMEADACISESASETEQKILDLPTQHANTSDVGDNSDNEMDFEVPGIYEEPHPRSPIPAGSIRVSPAASSESPNRRATVEDADDDDDVDDEMSRWIEEFPRPAGVPIGEGVREWRRDQVNKKELPWSPFESREEWELGQWLITSGISQKKIDEFLNLKMVSF